MLIQDVWQDHQLIAELNHAREALVAKGCTHIELSMLATEIGHQNAAPSFCAVLRQNAWEKLSLDREKECNGPQYRH